MKSLKFFLGGVFLLTLLALGACDNSEPQVPDDQTYDDSYYANLASIGSADSNFTATSDGGTIYFKVSGGSVVVSVDCGTAWTVENAASDLFTTTLSSSDLTVTAGQNTVEQAQTGTITLYTVAQHVKFAVITVTQEAYGAPEITVGTNEWHAPAAGVLTTEISVEASAGWTVENTADWLTAEASDSKLILTAAENEETAERSAKLTLVCTDGIRTVNEYISVTQDGKVQLTLSSENVMLTGVGDSSSITVGSNYEWDYSYDSDNGWYTVTRDGDGLIFTSSQDNETDENFKGTVTVTSGDGAGNVVEGLINIEESNRNALILVYTITSAGTEVILPLAGTVDCNVSWGDGGGFDAVTSANPTHTYKTTGKFSVVVDGNVTSLSHSGINSKTKVNTTLTAVRQWGNTGLTSASYALYYCESLTSIPDDTLGAFANVTTCFYMFDHCFALASIPEGLFTYASNVTSFSNCFGYCTALTAFPGGLFANCSSADSFEYAFRSCTGVETVEEGFFDGCPAATNFKDAFYGCTALKQIPAGIFSKNTEATTFYGVFYDCPSIESLPENLFANCSKVTTFESAFYGDTALASVPESTFSGCTAATTFRYVFYGCSALTAVPGNLFKDCTAGTAFSYAFMNAGLTSIPENLFANNTAATAFSYAFYGCKALTSVPSGLFSNNAAVTTYADCFYNCSALSEIGSGLFANNSAVTTYGYAFYGCSALTAIPENLFADSKAVITFTSTFSGCSSLAGESAYDVVTVGDESVKVHIYEREYYTGELYGYTAPTTYAGCYDSCSGLTDYTTDIPKSWGGGKHMDLSGVLGTYTASAYTYDYDTDGAKYSTWTLKIYESNKSGFDVFIDGLVPGAAGRYPESEASIAQATYADGKLTIPAQLTGYNTTAFFIGWYPCTEYTEESGWYRSAHITDLTFTYDSATDSWTSDYGEYLAAFLTNVATNFWFGGFFDVANPPITIKRTSTSTQSVKSDVGTVREINDQAVINTGIVLTE